MMKVFALPMLKTAGCFCVEAAASGELLAMATKPA